jgi:hypothetical protein
MRRVGIPGSPGAGFRLPRAGRSARIDLDN